MGLGAGVALEQVMAQQLSRGLQGEAPAAVAAAAAASAAAPAPMRPDEVMATLEKLTDLKAKGILTEDEFSANKAGLLKQLVQARAVATSSQRAYRAACPNCGAAVDFASAASSTAVCGFCRSTLLRDGDTLRAGQRVLADSRA